MLHLAWRVSLVAVLGTGLFHLVNLIGPSRGGVGPTLVTPFRAAFAISWTLLLVESIRERRRPRPDATDYLVAALAAIFLLRGLITPDTFSITFNWVLTGAGIFYLVKFGVRDKTDVRVAVASIAAAVVAVGFIGLIEFVFKSNPLFDAVQVDVIGADKRVQASEQFYRIRSVIGHPGFVGSVLVAGTPLILLSFWRRRWLMAVSLVLVAAALFQTYSRGSWILAAVFLIPVLVYRGRFWLKRNAKWWAPVVIIPTLLITIDYLRREEVSAFLGRKPVEDGLIWTKGRDGPCLLASGLAEGTMPLNKFIYFDVDDDFFRNQHGAVTITVHYFDRGTGAIHIDYDSWDETGKEDGAYTQSGFVNKTDTYRWTTTAFYLENPRFDDRQNSGADFRIVDDDSLFIVDRVTLQKGKMKLPSVIAQQWESRTGSITERGDLYPWSWSVFRENPWGVGIFNSPGTDHHAVDSLPLTWLMEFGWLSLPLLGLMLFAVVREGIYAFRIRRGPAVVLYLSLILLLLHGAHLMILYDKPNLVMFSALGALYALIRPWRAGGALIDVSNSDCML